MICLHVVRLLIMITSCLSKRVVFRYKNHNGLRIHTCVSVFSESWWFQAWNRFHFQPSALYLKLTSSSVPLWCLLVPASNTGPAVPPLPCHAPPPGPRVRKGRPGALEYSRPRINPELLPAEWLPLLLNYKSVSENYSFLVLCL